jgi:hypothetical protein
MMISSFPVKLMAAAVAVFLLMGDIPTTSALVPSGNNSFYFHHINYIC